MKRIIYFLSGVFIVLLSFTSCDNTSIDDFETDTIIVQSYLIAERSLDSFRVTQSIGYTDTTTDVKTIDDLIIEISDGTNTYSLESIGDGYYENSSLLIKEATNYSMQFQSGETIVTANTFVPEKKEVTISPTEISISKVEAGVMMQPPTQTDPIDITWENSEGDYFYVLVENIESYPEYINENFGNSLGDRGFITEPSITSEYNVDTRREIQYFGTYRVVVYRVNPEYAALYSTAESTSSSIVEPPTNIENGLGIMTGISTDTVYFEVTKL